MDCRLSRRAHSKGTHVVTWDNFLQESLDEAQEQGLLRTRVARSLRHHAILGNCSENLVNFASNDYLGLSRNGEVCRRAHEILIAAELGAGASPLVSGYTVKHQELERALAEFQQAEAAVVFSSGYACNLGVVASLVGSDDAVLSDRLNHASLIDGCRLSGARIFVYPHGDADFVRKFLVGQRQRFRRVLIISESIFSMDGDAAPLKDLASIAQQYDSGLAVDEAHATGVYGIRGAGLIEELGLSDQVLVKLGTLSKAIGGVGGFVAGSSALCNFVVNRCRSYVYSTALPASCAAAAIESVRQITLLANERNELRRTAQSLRCTLSGLGWQVPDGDSPIIPVIVGDEELAMEIAQRLRQRGFLVPAIRPPTVPRATSRLRISLSTQHDQEAIDRFVTALESSRDGLLQRHPQIAKSKLATNER